MHSFDRFRLQLFARRGGRNYMMRSEKRPSYNHVHKPKKYKRRTRVGYLLLTLLVSILVWPVGLFLIWNRRLRCTVGAKLLWSVVTLAISCGLVIALLTVPTGNAQFQRFQDDANDFIATVGTDAKLAWETFSDRAQDAFVNMKTVGCSTGNFLLNKLADGIDAGVDAASNVRSWVDGLLPDAQTTEPDADATETDAATTEPDAATTETDAATTEPSAQPSEEATLPPVAAVEPDASAASVNEPEATGEVSATQTPATDAGSDTGSTPARLAASGLALARAVLPASDTPAPTASIEPSAQPTSAVQTDSTPAASSVADAEATPAASSVADAEATPAASSVADAEATPAASSVADAEITPAPGAQATPQPTGDAQSTQSPQPTLKPAGQFTVYHTDGGSWYHTTANCSGMRGAQAYTLAESVADGFAPCSRCGAPAAEAVDAQNMVWLDDSSVWHVSDECEAFSGAATLTALSEATADGLTPCEACGADALAPVGAQGQSTADPAADEAALLELAKDVTVYFYDGSIGYHMESSCYGMSGAPARTLYEAIQAGKNRCSRCQPPTLEDLAQDGATAAQ